MYCSRSKGKFNYFLFSNTLREENSHISFSSLPSDQPGKSETYLEAIRKNIEWLKKHNKEEGKDGET